MSIWVYIIRGESARRYYCGQTSNLAKRLAQHNDPEDRLTLTPKRFAGPWALVWSRGCPTRSEAMRLERTIKGRGISRYLKEIESQNKTAVNPARGEGELALSRAKGALPGEPIKNQ